MRAEQPTRSYLICATPRSGSTLLCEALRITGLAGNPDEYFGPMHVKRWNEEWRTRSKADYLERVVEVAKGENESKSCEYTGKMPSSFFESLLI
jgi:LPS sulfotransferase NodH